MRVCQKLIFSYLFVSLLGCVAGYFGIKAMNDIQMEFDGVSNETIPVKNELNNMQASLNNIVIYTNEIIFLEHKIKNHNTSSKEGSALKSRTQELFKEINEWKEDQNDYQKSLARYEALVNKFFPEEKEYLNKIKVSSHNLLRVSANLINSETSNRDNSSIILMQAELEKANEQFDEVIKQALKHEDVELEGRKDSLYQLLNKYRNSIFAVTVLGLLLALAIAYLISRSILNSINKLQGAALEIGKGNLDVRIETSEKDELGLLANTFDHMAEDLQQATAYTLNICESLTESLIVLSPNSIIQSVNQSTCNLLGYSPTDLVGQPANILLTDKDPILQNLTLDHLIATGAITNLETNYRARTGSNIPILFSASILTDRKGVTLGIVYLAQDIADLKQMQEKNALLATALENVADAIEITDNTAKYLYVNAAFERITGYTQQEVLGQTPAAIMRSGKHSSEFYAEMFDTVAHGQIWNGLQVSKRKDGTLYDQEVTLSPILNADGLFTHIVAVKRDITDRLQSEARLKEAERRWRTLLEDMKLVVVGLDCLGKVDYVNAFFLELSGYSQAEVIGKDWFEHFLPQHQRKQVHQCFLDILMQEFHPNYQNSILTKSGEERIIAWNNTVLHSPQGEIVGTMSIGEDITERQVMERIKDEFISVVSHELRTPLASIHGGLNLLSSGLMDPQSEKGRRVIQIASDNADRLVLLVNDILELERLESGKIRLAMQRCNTAELIVKATNMTQMMAKQAGITLSVSSQDIPVSADPDRIIQVLTNLLSNAIKFSDRGSTVWITLEPQLEKDCVLFTIHDQGRGIPEDQLDSIFERFHQVDASDSRKKGGTGLGLAICQSIVQQHGGQIWVKSNLGEGSSFCFTLPIVSKDQDHGTQKNISH
jgi:PAS domain S-box-containing protein